MAEKKNVDGGLDFTSVSNSDAGGAMLPVDMNRFLMKSDVHEFVVNASNDGKLVVFTKGDGDDAEICGAAIDQEMLASYILLASGDEDVFFDLFENFVHVENFEHGTIGILNNDGAPVVRFLSDAMSRPVLGLVNTDFLQENLLSDEYGDVMFSKKAASEIVDGIEGWPDLQDSILNRLNEGRKHLEERINDSADAMTEVRADDWRRLLDSAQSCVDRVDHMVSSSNIVGMSEYHEGLFFADAQLGSP